MQADKDHMNESHENHNDVTDDYNADSLIEEKYPWNVRMRPSMYLGDNGMQKSVATREILDNSSGEFVKGYATRMKVTFYEDGSVEVQDDGRGLPVDTNTQSGKNGIVLTMATLHAGANFTSDVAKGKAGAGLNGVGASATNAVSKRFDVHVYRNDKVYELSFRQGQPGFFSEDDDPDSKFTPSDEVRVSDDTRSKREKQRYQHGTRIRFWFDDLFTYKDDTGETVTEQIDIDDLVARLDYLSYDLPGFDITVTDETRHYEDGSKYSWHFKSKDGIVELADKLDDDPVLQGSEEKTGEWGKRGVHTIQCEAHYDEITDDPKTHQRVEVQRTAVSNVAFKWSNGYDSHVVSFVNTVRTHLGGVHEDAFIKSMTDVFTNKMRSMRGILTAKDDDPTSQDVIEGLSLVLSINVPEPQFAGQQKDRLSGRALKSSLTKAYTGQLERYVNAPSNQQWLRNVLTKVKQAQKNRESAEAAKAAKRKARKSAWRMPSKLSDCDFTDTDEAELLICEGDSAAGTVEKAREAAFQAVLPIRGKILNCFNAKPAKILANQEIIDITRALGAGFGKDFDPDQCRYGRVLFAADADPDGLQIDNLLFTVFNRCFHPLVEQGRVYQTVPPLFEVTPKGKNQQTLYCVDEQELDRTIAELDKRGVQYRIERNKGLGEMDVDSFYDTVLDPSKRTLRRVTVGEAERAEKALMLTMGANSDARRRFMADNYESVLSDGMLV